MGKQGRKPRKAEPTAATADRFDLYELSVQDPPVTCEFIDSVFEEHDRPRPRSLREDFCGTGRNAVEWVRRRKSNTAIGYDLDPEVLERARRHVKRRLQKSMRERIRFLRGNVVTVRPDPVDCVLAQNFSYFSFQTRGLLRRYFRAVRRGLNDDGLFILDIYGGSDALLPMEEPRDIDDFEYVWDQQEFDPLSARAATAIHFRFPDGSEIENAFVYDWRLWTVPEVREVLLESGFGSLTVYLETMEDGEGTGEWERAETGEAIEGWVANLVAVPV